MGAYFQGVELTKVVVIDYGMGNVGSVMNMLKKAGATALLSKVPGDLDLADRLILPGVGAFDTGMQNLQRMGYLDALNYQVIDKRTPILGICIGAQLFTRGSEEGCEPGLGWLDADTVRFRFPEDADKPKVPHMGWNTVQICKPTSLFPDTEQGRRFYFVHSFHLRCNNPGDVLTSTHHGYEFTSAVCHGNILGVQFHPEKSHRWGLELFRAFLEWTPLPLES